MMRLHRDNCRIGLPCVRVLALITLIFILSACSEALNWRVMPVGETGWDAMMPCKPVAAQREVDLLGQPVTLNMRSCDAQDATFAVAWLPLPKGVDAEAALTLWRQASQRSAQVKEVDEPVVWALRDAVLAQRWQGQGQRGARHPIEVSLGHALIEQHLVQWAIYGKTAPADVETFWEGVAKPRR